MTRTCDCTMRDCGRRSMVVQLHVLYSHWPPAVVAHFKSTRVVLNTVLHWLVKPHVFHSRMKCCRRDRCRCLLIGHVNPSQLVPSPTPCVWHQSISKALAGANSLLIDWSKADTLLGRVGRSERANVPGVVLQTHSHTHKHTDSRFSIKWQVRSVSLCAT